MSGSMTKSMLGFLCVIAVLVGLYGPAVAAPTENNPGQPFEQLSAEHQAIHNQIGTLELQIGTLATKAEMSVQHDMIQQDIADVEALVEALDVPLCGAETAGERFILQGGDTEVCDNTTGYVWEQTPDTGVFTHAQAITHCQSKGGGWDLPEVQQLGSVVGYGNTNPALPTDHPFTIPGPDATVTTIGYWAATLFAGAPTSTGWAIAFIDGDVDMVFLSRNNIRAWCMR